jgi:hypothetical protein
MKLRIGDLLLVTGVSCVAISCSALFSAVALTGEEILPSCRTAAAVAAAVLLLLEAAVAAL